MSPSPGQPVEERLISGRYKLVRNLGTGASGTVFLAWDSRDEREVALKILHKDRLGAEGIQALQREFRTLVTLSHSQIAAAHDFGYCDDDETPYFTREFIPGRPLLPGPPSLDSTISPATYLRPIVEVADALHYLHSHEILHLDVHAGNVIEATNPDRGSVLIDFGLMRPFGRSGESGWLGLRYPMLPEAGDGEPCDVAADIFLIGRLLLYRLTGRTEGEARLPPEIPGWGGRMTLDLERILSKSLQPDPQRRFESVVEFRDALKSILGDDGHESSSSGPAKLTVGRKQELSAIEEALSGVLQGERSVIYFCGPSGVGKSRLLTEARWSSQLRGLVTVFVRGIAEPSGEPPLLRALREELGEGRGGPSWLVPLAVEHGGSTADRAKRVANAYFAEDGPPLTLIVDDFHHADRETRLLASALARETIRRRTEGAGGRGIAVFLAGEAFEDSLAAVQSPVRLTPLSRPESEALALKLLRPLRVPRSVVKDLVAKARGLPGALCTLARFLHRRSGESVALTANTDLPDVYSEATETSRAEANRSPLQRQVLQALSVLSGPATSRELQAATELSTRVLAQTLGGLVSDGILVEESVSGRTRFDFNSRVVRGRFLETVSKSEKKRIHLSLVSYFRGRKKLSLEDSERLALHLLRGGSRVAAREMVRDTVVALRARGFLEGALRILKEVLLGERSRKWRLFFSEQVSAIHYEAGDHQEGVSALNQLNLDELGPREAVRVRRRMGAHHHRAGFAKEAKEVFHEAIVLADPSKDGRELVFVYSELAELHTLRDEYEAAQEACRKGLEILESLKLDDEKFRGEMEMMLRGSMGHLELRRFDLERSRLELERAERLSRRFGSASSRVLLLNNLGVVFNHQNDLARALRCYEKAEALLRRSGKRRERILISTNLATIAAKSGRAQEARRYLDTANDLLAHSPDRRLKFAVALGQGVASHLLGEEEEALRSFRIAEPIGEELGDVQSVLFARAYSAEAEIACGRYGSAIRLLKLLLTAGPEHSDVGEGLAHARLFFVESLLGRPRAAERSLRRWSERSGSSGLLVERWNDLFVAAGFSLRGEFERAEALFEETERAFRDLGIPLGARLSKLGSIGVSIARGDVARSGGESLLRGGDTRPFHRFLSVAEPLIRGERFFILRNLERASECVEDAAAAIVGLPFIELDWRIEFLRARIAERYGDRNGARSHLHRVLHLRDLLARSVSAPLRAKFLGHPRFAEIQALVDRTQRPRPTPHRPAVGLREYEGMVGKSAAMRGVFEVIERLQDQELPVLILGETGTGKELVARAVHRRGPRSQAEFFTLDCASLPPELFESELFGHVAGAFTGAVGSRPGVLQRLSGGTLLLDSPECLPPAMQRKFLRVLDRGMVRKVGGVEEQVIDVRFLAASSAPFQEQAGSNELLQDLYFRLAAVEIRVPPLRTRKQDIPDLVDHFLKIHASRLGRQVQSLSKGAMKLLLAFDWPGNVRQLETVLLRALVQSSPGVELSEFALRGALPGPEESSLFTREFVAGRNLNRMRNELETVYLKQLFAEKQGDVVSMATDLGVTQPTLYRWFKKLGIDVRALRRET